MRPTKPGVAAALGAAVVLAAVVLGPTAPADASAGAARASAVAGGTPTPAPLVFCGTDAASGLGVSADRAGSCAVALEVAAAYTRIVQHTRGAPAEVRTAGATWVCRERQGDPDPYLECLGRGDSGGRVTLTS
ncbi:hypothetical protein ACWEPM_19045 [Streptomyces sp. NPDC004244]|uniref:hypothetical protein n=1 Tax=Streptomyces sp. NPDC101206 TaxID=3366128 RepID=UPI0037FBEEB1